LRDTALIKFTVKTNPLGIRESLTAEWEGKSPYTYVSFFLVDRGEAMRIKGDEEIQIGPYRLLKVDTDWSMGAWLYVRKDRLGALRIALYKSTRLLDLIYRRLIITLAVWRLADYHQHTIPTWRDIKGLKGFVKK
jgi:hypothetical protein